MRPLRSPSWHVPKVCRTVPLNRWRTLGCRFSRRVMAEVPQAVTGSSAGVGFPIDREVRHRTGGAIRLDDADPFSITVLVLDDVEALLSEPSDVVEHPPQAVRGMALPSVHLIDHEHRVGSSE